MEVDILINYSTEDNEVEGEDIGWGSNFKNFLGTTLHQILDKKITLVTKKGEKLQRLIWIHPDQKKSSSKQKIFVEKLCRNFDIAVVFQEKVNTNWLKVKMLDLLKAPGLGRVSPILGKAIIAGDNAELNTNSFENYEVDLIQQSGKKSSKEVLLDFIKGRIKQYEYH